MKKSKKILIWSLLYIVTFVLGLYLTLVIVFNSEISEEFSVQAERMERLRQNPGTPIDESSFANFDINDNTLRLNEIQVLSTHNSYKRMPNMFISRPQQLFSSRVKNGYYEYSSLTDQLNKGIRGLEIDITSYDGKIVINHNPSTDWRTNGIDFLLALEEIKIWSDLNSGHIPLNIMLQVRNSWSPFSHKFGAFTAEDMTKLDNILEEYFGNNNIIKPSDVIGTNDTLRVAVENDGWPMLTDCLGKVYFSLMFDVGDPSKQNYIDIDPTFKTQKAFIMTKLEALCDYSAIIHADDPFKEGQSELVSKNYILRTRIDEQFSYSEERWRASIELGSVILATDHMEGHFFPTDYVCKLTPDNKTIIARGSVL